MEKFPNSGDTAMNARPVRVQKARLEGDIAYLSAAGRKGAQKAAQNRDADRMMRERIAEQRLQDDYERRLQAGEILEDPRDMIYG